MGAQSRQGLPQRNLDLHAVLSCGYFGKHFPRFSHQFPRLFRISRAEVSQDQPLHTSSRSHLTGFSCSGVPGLGSSSRIVVTERRLVNKHISTSRRFASRLARRRIRRINEATSWSRGTDQVSRPDFCTIRQRHVLTPVEAPKKWTLRHPCGTCPLHIESTEAIFLDEDESE